MKSEHCQAVVLSALDYGETDRIVTLFTLEHGRLRAFAKSARKSRKRFGGGLEPGNRLDVTLGLKVDGLSRLERGDATSGCATTRDQLESLALTMYCCELVDALTPEGHPLPRLYRLLCALLDYLNLAAANQSDRRFFEINLLNILGYRPQTDDKRLHSLQDCLRTGKFGLVHLSDEALTYGGRILDTAIASNTVRPLKSLTFLTDVLK